MELLKELCILLVKGKDVLEAIDETNSLSLAAKKLSFSYRTVWGYVVKLNNLLGRKVVETRKGGKEKGGACLTKEGKELLYFLKGLERSFKDVPIKSNRYLVRTSARNQIFGKVLSVEMRGINGIVTVEVDTGDLVKVSITKESVEDLKVESGKEVFLLIKAPWVKVSKSLAEVKGENVYPSRILEKAEGEGKAELFLETERGTFLTSVVEGKSCSNLKVDDEVYAFFKKEHVILGV